MRPVKFDFSSYTAAISAIPAIQEQETPLRIAESQESQATEGKKADFLPDDAVLQNRRIAKDYGDFQDDRHHCRECRNIETASASGSDSDRWTTYHADAKTSPPTRIGSAGASAVKPRTMPKVDTSSFL